MGCTGRTRLLHHNPASPARYVVEAKTSKVCQTSEVLAFPGHAELVALEQADRLGLPYEQRRRARLFTNLEPCLMCMGAAMSFFLGEIAYGLESPGDGAVNLVEAWDRNVDDLPGYQLPRITGGLLREESIRLFERYVSACPPGPMRDWAETLTSRP
jgi:tRNA(adenine34) deaminase